MFPIPPSIPCHNYLPSLIGRVSTCSPSAPVPARTKMPFTFRVMVKVSIPSSPLEFTDTWGLWVGKRWCARHILLTGTYCPLHKCNVEPCLCFDYALFTCLYISITHIVSISSRLIPHFHAASCYGQATGKNETVVSIVPQQRHSPMPCDEPRMGLDFVCQ